MPRGATGDRPTPHTDDAPPDQPSRHHAITHSGDTTPAHTPTRTTARQPLTVRASGSLEAVRRTPTRSVTSDGGVPPTLAATTTYTNSRSDNHNHNDKTNFTDDRTAKGQQHHDSTALPDPKRRRRGATPIALDDLIPETTIPPYTRRLDQDDEPRHDSQTRRGRRRRGQTRDDRIEPPPRFGDNSACDDGDDTCHCRRSTRRPARRDAHPAAARDQRHAAPMTPNHAVATTPQLAPDHAGQRTRRPTLRRNELTPDDDAEATGTKRRQDDPAAIPLPAPGWANAPQPRRPVFVFDGLLTYTPPGPGYHGHRSQGTQAPTHRRRRPTMRSTPRRDRHRGRTRAQPRGQHTEGCPDRHDTGSPPATQAPQTRSNAEAHFTWEGKVFGNTTARNIDYICLDTETATRGAGPHGVIWTLTVPSDHCLVYQGILIHHAHWRTVAASQRGLPKPITLTNEDAWTAYITAAMDAWTAAHMHQDPTDLVANGMHHSRRTVPGRDTAATTGAERRDLERHLRQRRRR